MKFFHRPPTTEAGQQFFTRYASLVPTLTRAGILAQIISALTEWGILYALIYSSLVTFWPSYAGRAALVGATLAVLVVELGLRRLLPFAARAIIHRRWQGLDRYISAIVLAATVVLMTVSAVLSFAGSRSMVAEITPPPAPATAATSDSLATAEAALVKSDWQQAESELATTYAARAEGVKTAAAATVRRLDAELATYTARERATGRRYTTRKAEVRATREAALADRDEQLASLTSAREDELAGLRTRSRARLSALTSARDSSRHQVASANAEALTAHQNDVNRYGGGLAWFTVVCLLVLVVAVVIRELHHAGSGIEEQAEPTAYTFDASPLAALTSALSARTGQIIFALVHHIERTTPEAPEPVAAPMVWQRPGGLKVARSSGMVRRIPKPLKPLRDASPLPAPRRAVGFNRKPMKATERTNDAPAPLDALTQSANASEGKQAKATPKTGEDDLATSTDDGKRGTCKHCGQSYQRRTTWQKFCSAECRKDHHAARHGGTPFSPAKGSGK